MARISGTVGLGLAWLCLMLPACEPRQNAKENSGEKTTSWRATPKYPTLDEGKQSGDLEDNGKATPPQPPTKTESPSSQAVKSQPAVGPVEPQPAPRPKVPNVGLSEKLRATCLVCVNDAFPDGQLADLSGKKQTLKELCDKRPAVVFLWSNGKTDSTKPAGDAALRDLQLDFFKPHQEQGLTVVGVNVGDSPADVKAQAEKAGVKFPVLLDSQGDFFHKVATQELPRVYLLDAAGNVRWFDIDFTYISRQNLSEAIEALLKQPQG